VKLVVCDILGRQVSVLVNEIRPPGTYTIRFNASGLSSGLYIARFESAGRSATHKILLLR
jgi:hypothetical protein